VLDFIFQKINALVDFELEKSLPLDVKHSTIIALDRIHHYTSSVS